ncbi:MAG: hypothetical protein RL571_770 [Pseudomonadota bacterium]|jgi:hypothetical protein
MSDLLKKHRVIGIRHTLKEIKNAGLISDGINYPSDAVAELQRVANKANGAKRHRAARKDAAVPSLIQTIQSLFDLPEGSVQLVYPSGRRAGANASIGSFRRNWENYKNS